MNTANFTREAIEVQTADDLTLTGWLYLPERREFPVPGIVMAHGFAALKEHFLERFAECFAEAGFAVVLYDHRNFGASGGKIRHEIDPWQQIRDERDVITWLTLRPEIDETRIGIWGTSYSGGHALVLGAIDRRVRCVVAQVPTISGYQQSLRRVRPDAMAAARRNFDADRKARFQGEPPVMRAIVPPEPGQSAINFGDDAREFYLSLEGRTDISWQNAVTLRSAEMSSEYEPGVYVSRITPTPLLLIVAEQDDVTPTDLAMDAYRQALEPKRLFILRGGHFSPYQEKFAEASAAALEWFELHLFSR